MRLNKLAIIIFCAVILSASAVAQNIVYQGSYDQLQNAFDVVVEWPLAYVCQHLAYPSFIILDMSNTQNIQVVGLLHYTDPTQDLYIQGSYAYLANDVDGLKIVDISNPSAPFYVGGIGLGDRAYSVYVKGDIAYVADGYAGLYLVDVSDPANPSEISNYTNVFSSSGVLVRGSKVYMTDHSTILQTIDITDTQNPVQMDAYFGPGYARRGIALFGDYAIVSAWAYGLHIIDIIDPYNLTAVNTFPTPGNCIGVWAADYIYVTNYEAGLQVFDIADPLNPVLIGSYQTPSNARGVTVDGNYIYVADESSLQILSLGTVGTGESGVGMPFMMELSQNYPNPFNAATTVKFELSSETDIDLSIYNLQGQKIGTLARGLYKAGGHKTTWNAAGLPSGIYFARLIAAGDSKSVKMQLLK